MPSPVRVGGKLICKNPAELATVLECVPGHTALTRGEPGCIMFEVRRTGNPHRFAVDEEFVDRRHPQAAMRYTSSTTSWRSPWMIRVRAAGVSLS